MNPVLLATLLARVPEEAREWPLLIASVSPLKPVSLYVDPEKKVVWIEQVAVDWPRKEADE